MGKRERAFWDFIIRCRIEIFILFSSLLALYARFCMRSIVSGDMANCLIPWFDWIKAGGGLSMLSEQVGNYNIPYQTLIAIMTYLPFIPLHAYKLLSTVFDFALASAVAAGVFKLSGNKTKAAVSYTITLFLPAVILNSSAWGQCDSIFTFFLVLSFVFLIQEKNVTAFLLYGCSFAFKLQAVFFLPFLIFYYVWSRKISIWHFFLALIPIILLSTGGFLYGRDFRSVFSIYSDQIMLENPHIAWNYPSFWLLLVKNLALDGSDHYEELHVLCLAVTVIILGIIMLLLIRRKNFNQITLLLTAVLMTYTCVLFLPSMHDRYAYPVVIMSLLACFVEPRMIPTAIGHLILETEMYGSGLLFKVPLPWEVMMLINLFCYVSIAWITAKNVRCSSEMHPEKETESV